MQPLNEWLLNDLCRVLAIGCGGYAASAKDMYVLSSTSL